MRSGVPLDKRQVLNDSGGSSKHEIVLCASRDLQLVLLFRELHPAVPGEIEEEPSSMADSLQLWPTAKTTNAQNKYDSY